MIQYINNPSKKVQLEAVKQNGDAIKYINNPSKEVQFEAVKENSEVIQYIYKCLSKEDLVKIKLIYGDK